MTITYIETEQGRVEASGVTKPSERTFRDAWQLNNGVIEVDMDGAREIWRDKIRTSRISVLDGLDADYMKALELGDVTLQQTIAAQKQILRDAPNDADIDAALNVEELKTVKPAGLSIS